MTYNVASGTLNSAIPFPDMVYKFLSSWCSCSDDFLSSWCSCSGDAW